MSDPRLSDVLTPERLLELRMLLANAKRLPNGMPYRRNRTCMKWLAHHGYGVWGPPAPPVLSTERQRGRVVRPFEVTQKGRDAVAAWEAAQRRAG